MGKRENFRKVEAKFVLHSPDGQVTEITEEEAIRLIHEDAPGMGDMTNFLKITNGSHFLSDGGTICYQNVEYTDGRHRGLGSVDLDIFGGGMNFFG